MVSQSRYLFPPKRIYKISQLHTPCMASTRLLERTTVLFLLLLFTDKYQALPASHTVSSSAGSSHQASSHSTPAPPPLCCEGVIMGLNTSISMPSTCPAPSNPDDGPSPNQWRTTNDSACPADRPTCIRLNCTMRFRDSNGTFTNISLFTLTQGCNTSASALIAYASEATGLTCTDITPTPPAAASAAADDDTPLLITEESDTGLGPGAIAGIVIGTVAGVGLIALCITVAYTKQGSNIVASKVRPDVLFTKVRLSPA